MTRRSRCRGRVPMSVPAPDDWPALPGSRCDGARGHAIRHEVSMVTPKGKRMRCRWDAKGTLTEVLS